MSYVLRFGAIVSLVGLFLCGLAYLKPDILADVRLNIWDGPRQLGHLNREKNRSRYIEALKRKIAVRRAEVHRILQALCREEIGLGEAAFASRPWKPARIFLLCSVRFVRTKPGSRKCICGSSKESGTS